MPHPDIAESTSEELLSRLQRLGELHAELVRDAHRRHQADLDDLTAAIESTMRVLDVILIERGYYRDDAVQALRIEALSAAGLSLNPRRWLDDVHIETLGTDSGEYK